MTFINHVVSTSPYGTLRFQHVSPTGIHLTTLPCDYTAYTLVIT